MPTVKNIDQIQYFLNRFPTIDSGFDYKVNYHPMAKSEFTSLPTFMAEFFDCKVHSCPLLVTNEDHLITHHVWNLTHNRKHKPKKTHNLWDSWGEEINIRLPKVTKFFNERYTYVWLPIDEESANNPWHVWIDIVSKFRLIEKRWSTLFTKYCFVLSNPSTYFDKIQKEFFPDLNYMVLPKNETWQFTHLIVPSLSNHNDGVIAPALGPWMRVLKNILDVGPCKNRKIYVSRKKAATRRLVNAEKMLMALKGWETVVLEDMSIKEQVQCFAEATHIVSPHGAGLTNLLWCQEGTKVFELTHEAFIQKKVYPSLSHHLGLEHTVILCETEKINTKKPKNKKSKDMVNLKIDIPALIRILD